MNASEGALLSVAISDVTDRKQATDALAHRASHDPLTGLPNRALFLDRLEHGLARARRSTHRLAIVFLDLDDFKIVNDTRGHDVGDLLLRTLAPRLSAALRPGDTIARFGGDEFVVLCEDLESDADALNIARRMAAACAEPVDLRGWRHSVSVSAGIAVLPPGRPLSAAELLRDADTAMYRAKASGKGRIELFDDGMRAHLDQQLEAEAALAWALDRDELRLVYQPILSLRDSQIVGVEALLRWQHPQRGMLEPSEFIELAKTSGLIVPIGDWAIGEACRQVAEWNRGRSDQPPLFVSVNLAPRQVRRDLIASVARSLRASGLEPRLLELEITEEVLLDKASRRVEVLRELKRLGVRIALDDYGTGYSSLTDLRRLTIDALKLDRSFVHGLGHDSEDAAIVSAALSMADALELGVTAEGVETLPQLARLRAGGCEYAQGYLFAPPAPASELEALLERGLAAGGVAA
jgi:diguanylate cyclase (GGDEF)-like protein